MIADIGALCSALNRCSFSSSSALASSLSASPPLSAKGRSSSLSPNCSTSPQNLPPRRSCSPSPSSGPSLGRLRNYPPTPLAEKRSLPTRHSRSPTRKPILPFPSPPVSSLGQKKPASESASTTPSPNHPSPNLPSPRLPSPPSLLLFSPMGLLSPLTPAHFRV